MINFPLCIFLISIFIGLIQSTFSIPIGVPEYYPDERIGLLQFRDSLASNSNLHSKWSGPPCYYNQSKWLGVSCFNGHVIHLVLDGIQLQGSLPPSFLQNLTFLSKFSLRNNLIFGPLPILTNLNELEFIFLSQNHFSSSIPLDYALLPKLTSFELQENYLDGPIPFFNQTTLTSFNVSFNHLEGPIPHTTVLQSFSASCYEHNTNLCGTPLENQCYVPPPSPHSPAPPQEKKKERLEVWSIALITAAAILIPFLVMLVFLCYYKRVHAKEKTRGDQQGDGSSEQIESTHNSNKREDPERTTQLEFFDKEISVFDLDDLLRASAEMLGKGKLGNTYKATLESGSTFAVKRLKHMNGLSKKEFGQQMQLLGKMRHQNLTQVISFYHYKDEKLVVYEFVPHSNLYQLLHENRGVGRAPLNWTTRVSIIKDIAKGLNFLHQSLHSQKVPHANLKSSNVLILQDGENYTSKLTDFGFLPLLPSRKSSEKLALGRSPELHQGKKLTHKTDVYCFGIVLLEILTGRIPEEISPGENEETSEDISSWARKVVNSDWSTDIFDEEIIGTKEGHNEMLRLAEIAIECTDIEPEKRPKMSEVLRQIELIENKRDE